MPYQYGHGFEKDLKSLVKLIKKEYTIDFDPEFLDQEIKKIIKYNKPKKCPECGSSIFSIDGKEWKCEDQRSCGWRKKIQ